MLIDVNASFGGRETIQRFRVETMLEQLARTPCGVAFVRCQQGTSDHTSANDQTLALCRDHPTLRPVGVIHPRDAFTWRGEVERCLTAGVRLVQLYPEQGGWPIDSILLTQIVERLAGTGAVLMLEATPPGLPTKVAERTAAAGLPVIFTEARYGPLGELLPLVERYPHLMIETSRLTGPEGIERCVEAVGADRLVFGSGTARYPAWVTWQVLERAAISSEEREAIAWRNAARLLGVEPAPEASRGWSPAAPLSPSIPVIDVHLHDKFAGMPIPPFTASEYEHALTSHGIAAGVGSSATAIVYDLAMGNGEMAALIDNVPRLRGYVVVDPRYYDESLRELKRFDADPRFVGAKIHCSYSKTPTNTPRLRRLFAALAEHGKPVLIHNLGEDWPEALVEIAQAHPHLPIIAAHAGYGDGPHPTHDAALRVAPAANIFLEFCSTYLVTGAIRRGIDAVGVDRVLFGSDFPLISEPYMLAAYEDADLTAEETEKIMFQNARGLFPMLEVGDKGLR
jgi:predicted TIM-barrel fold metal-dependent hydrolase